VDDIVWLVLNPDATSPGNVLDEPLKDPSGWEGRYVNRLYAQGLRASGEFVVNVAPHEIARQVLFCGRRSGRDVDKFATTGLTSGQAQCVRPPIIEQCIAHLECRMVQEVEAGDHCLVIGEVLAAYTRPGVLDDNGLYDLSRTHPLLHLGRNRFTSTLAQYIEPPL